VLFCQRRFGWGIAELLKISNNIRRYDRYFDEIAGLARVVRQQCLYRA
jgi:hypothetical protein